MCSSNPIHVHDCRGCAFLGSHDGKDFYQCDHIDLCIRWGDADHENKSFPLSVAPREGDWAKGLELYAARYGAVLRCMRS